MKKVVATSMGFLNGSRVRPGTIVEVPDDFKGKWVTEVPVKGTSVEPAEKKASARAKPVALSQLGKEPTTGPLDNLV